MTTKPTVPATVDAYIAGFPKDVQGLLQQVRQTIREAAPEAQETIKYNIPTFTLNGNLISFAGYKTHIGIYPAPAGSQKFSRQLAAYRTAKASVRFPLTEPIPFDLISQLVKYRVKETRAGAKKG